MTGIKAAVPGGAMLFIVTGLFGLYTLEFGVVGLLPDIVRRFGVSTQQAGFLVAIFGLVVAVSGPFSALWSSRFQDKTVMVLTLGSFALISVLSALAVSFTELLILRAAAALLHPVFFATAFSAAARLYSPERRAQSTSTAIIGTTLGLVVGVPATAAIDGALSYQAAFGFCAALTGIAAIGVLTMYPAKSQGPPLTIRRQLRIMTKPTLWLTASSTVLVLAMMFAVYSYAATFLTTRTHLGAGAVSLLLIVFGIGGLTGNLLIGRPLSRHLQVTVLLHPVVLAGVYLLLYFLSSHLFGPMALIVLLWGAAHTAGLGVTQVWMTSTAPEAPKFATSLYVSAANAGVVVGATTGGAFISADGINGAALAGLIAAGLAILVLAPSIIWMRSRARGKSSSISPKT